MVVSATPVIQISTAKVEKVLKKSRVREAAYAKS
jgi:hypothetical protein